LGRNLPTLKVPFGETEVKSPESSKSNNGNPNFHLLRVSSREPVFVFGKTSSSARLLDNWMYN
jgi:hypothetical protein